MHCGGSCAAIPFQKGDMIRFRKQRTKIQIKRRNPLEYHVSDQVHYADHRPGGLCAGTRDGLSVPSHQQIRCYEHRTEYHPLYYYHQPPYVAADGETAEII